jgi:hypothetical protein
MMRVKKNFDFRKKIHYNNVGARKKCMEKDVDEELEVFRNDE